MLCRSQDTFVVHTALGRQERPLPKGEYKTLPNNPTLASGRIFYYAPPEDVPAEMHRLVASMESEEYAALHPVVQSAYVHYALAAIHPFADGNGRTARALASVPLYRDRRVPLMVLADDRDRVLDVLALCELTIRAGSPGDAAESLSALQRAAEAIRVRDETGVDATAGRLRAVIADELRARVAELPGEVVEAYDPYDVVEAPAGYRLSSKAPAIAAFASSAGVSQERRIDVFVASDRPSFLVQTPRGNVTFAVRDVDPTVRTVTRIKVRALIEALVADVLAGVAAEAEE
jgi:hypothetical protein